MQAMKLSVHVEVQVHRPSKCMHAWDGAACMVSMEAHERDRLALFGPSSSQDLYLFPAGL